MAALFRAIGLMSGTSMDGVDVALIETDGRTIAVSGNGGVETRGRTFERPYGEAEGALLRAAKDDAQRLISGRGDRPGRLAEAERLTTDSHAEAVEAYLTASGLRPTDIAVVGFHGQTVLHRPEDRLTVQIGDGQALADRLGIPVAYDFRADDVAAGGQGAPLVPVFHRALAQACGYELPLAVLNIGGVANVTFIGTAEDDLVGFDTGPGNALLNDLMLARRGLARDEDGATAALGRTDPDLLAWMLAHPYFAKPPPKSLDRDAFSHAFAGQAKVEDAASLLTDFTVQSIARSCAWTRSPPRRWIVGGGGARNREMMRRLQAALGVDVVPADEIGWTSDFLEAQAFAYLAARTLAGLPITFPSTTGVGKPLTGGRIARPR